MNDDISTMRNSIIYSNKVYAPESIFAGWLSLSYVLLTTSLLFYHMSQVKSIKATPIMSSSIAAALVIVSALYMIYSLGPYIGRMNHVIKICKLDPKCNKNELKRLIIVKNSYITLGIVTSIIQLIITWLIVKKSLK